MITDNGDQWNSRMNCQQFCRQFVTDGLGLDWPNEIEVGGDSIPVSIDIGPDPPSSTHEKKTKK
jgi:hypothetical protein